MKLNLNFNFKALDGEEFDNAGKTLANILAVSDTPGYLPIKAHDFAVKLFNDGEIEIDESDLDILEKIVMASKLSNIAKAQILEIIKKLEE